MGCLTHGGVVHVQVAADRAHNNLAGVQPHSDADHDTFFAAHAVGIPLHRLLHPQRGITRAHRVILVGERRAEQRHDPVAHHLVHRAFVAMDGLHHVLEDGVEDLARLLGIAFSEELHRALEIGEQHRHLLALAFEGSLGGEDLLGKVLRRVGLGRGEAHLPGRLAAYWSTALVADPGPGR